MQLKVERNCVLVQFVLLEDCRGLTMSNIEELKRKAAEQIELLKERGVFADRGTSSYKTNKMVAYELFDNLKKFVKGWPHGRTLPLFYIYQFIGKPEAKKIPKLFRDYLRRNGIYLKVLRNKGVVHVRYEDPIKKLPL